LPEPARLCRTLIADFTAPVNPQKAAAEQDQGRDLGKGVPAC
jgi:hypothetical protein